MVINYAVKRENKNKHYNDAWLYWEEHIYLLISGWKKMEHLFYNFRKEKKSNCFTPPYLNWCQDFSLHDHTFDKHQKLWTSSFHDLLTIDEFFQPSGLGIIKQGQGIWWQVYDNDLLKSTANSRLLQAPPPTKNISSSSFFFRRWFWAFWPWM